MERMTDLVIDETGSNFNFKWGHDILCSCFKAPSAYREQMDVGGEGGRAISRLLPFSILWGREMVAAGPWGLAVPVGRSGSAGLPSAGPV